LRQILKGLEAAKTEWAIVAKDDYVYPPEYFSFTPPTKDRVYSYSNVWVLGDKYWKKGPSEYAQMANRKFWIAQIKKALEGKEGWEETSFPPVFTDRGSWTSDNPVLNFKSTSGLRRFPSVLRNVFPKKSLPYWGTASELKARMGIV